MPSRWSCPQDRRDWPVKILRGTFSWNKRNELTHRYNRRRRRVEFAA